MRYIVRCGDNHVIMSTMQQATGLMIDLLNKGKAVEVIPTARPATHKNTYAALAAIDIAEMQLVG